MYSLNKATQQEGTTIWIHQLAQLHQMAQKQALNMLLRRSVLFSFGELRALVKSDIIRQITDTFSNSHLIDIRLSLWEPTDIKGIPYFDSNSGTMVWGAPEELPSEEFAAQFDHIVLFLDEMNSAAPSVQAAAYQLDS